MRGVLAAILAALALSGAPVAAHAAGPEDEEEAPAAAQAFALHGQATLVWQANAGFPSPYADVNSLNPHAAGKETVDATLEMGVRPWRGAEIWANAEIDQGFGLSSTSGVAGFPNAEAFKIGRGAPYVKLPRLFLRQTFDLGGEPQPVEADQNQLAGARASDRLTLTIGKFSVADLFDANTYAHDPRSDFLNLSVVGAGTFDYAANAWGYAYGGAAELYVRQWTFRTGLFSLARAPGELILSPTLHRYEVVAEAEHRHRLFRRAGAIRLTGFLNHGPMGRFDDALRLASVTGQTPDTAAVRRIRNRGGASVSFEQELAQGVGLFIRAGAANGKIEPYALSDIDRTLATGLSLSGRRWKRPEDTAGFAFAVNRISRVHQAYLAAGGMGILVGDGQLPHPGAERILEAYYDLAAPHGLRLGFDLQRIENPAYNRDRGPVLVGALRLHAEF